MLTKIISGGQTGVDRGALDAALEASFPCGGWCPQGRLAEDGAIDERYPVVELPGAGYRQRTRRNVEDSDGTLIIYFGELTGGTKETARFCDRLDKPSLLLDGLVAPVDAAADATLQFLRQHAVNVLNVAGPRESTHGGAAVYAQAVLAQVIGLCSKRG